jgi:hypothetical protein
LNCVGLLLSPLAGHYDAGLRTFELSKADLPEIDPSHRLIIISAKYAYLNEQGPKALDLAEMSLAGQRLVRCNIFKAVLKSIADARFGD